MKIMCSAFVITSVSVLCACGSEVTKSANSVNQFSAVTTSSAQSSNQSSVATTSSVQSSVTSHVLAAAVIATGRLNDTGISNCADYAYTDLETSYAVEGSGVHNANLNCSTMGASLTTGGVDANGDIVRGGQDALYGRDITHRDDSDGYAGFSYTKLDTNGIPLENQRQKSWACVKDNVTGLIWEVKTTDGLQAAFSTYGFHSFVDSRLEKNCSSDVCTTNAYIKEINALTLCGANDWRLPNNSELLSLVNYNTTNPAIDINYFPLSGSSYWSASHYDGIGLETWALESNTGAIFSDWIDGGPGKGIRLVRGTDPYNDGVVSGFNTIDHIKSNALYSDTSAGVVIDSETGLMWQKCSLGLSGNDCTIGSVQELTWQAALAAANENMDYGHDDWRLPNIKELESLVDNINSDADLHLPAINRVFFSNTVLGPYWSSTPFLSEAWFVDFWKGFVSRQSKNSVFALRLVRDST